MKNVPKEVASAVFRLLQRQGLSSRRHSLGHLDLAPLSSQLFLDAPPGWGLVSLTTLLGERYNSLEFAGVYVRRIRLPIRLILLVWS